MSGNNKFFGAMCKVWDNTLVVKMTSDDTGGTDAGSVWIYSRSGTTWSLNQTLRISGSSQFSHYTDFRNNLIVARDISGNGNVYIWEKINGVWTQIKKLEGTNASNQFGSAFALDDNTIVIGEYDEDTVSNAGAVYVYNKSTTAELKFDNYNKLSLTNTPTNTSSKLFFGSNVYDIGTLTSDLTIETPGLYKGLVFDTSSNVAYFNKTTVGSITTIDIKSELHGNCNYSTFSGSPASGTWTMGDYYVWKNRVNRGDRNNSLAIPTPSSSTDPFEIDFRDHRYVMSPIVNGFANSGENWPFPTKNGALWEMDMKNIELSIYNGGSRVTTNLDSTWGTSGSHYFNRFYLNSGSSCNLDIRVEYARTNAVGKIFKFYWRISANQPSGSNHENICEITNVDLSNDTVIKYGWYGGFSDGKPTFYLSIGGQTKTHDLTFSLNTTYRDFHDESYGGAEVADPQGPYNNNWGGHTGWPFNLIGGGDTRTDHVGENNTHEGRGALKRGLRFDCMYIRYSDVFEPNPTMTFDTYNKLTLKDITNPTSKIHALPTGAESTTTYDIGSAKNIYIESAGTYTAEMKAATKFALDSNVVTGLNDPVYITPKLDGGAIYIQGALDNAGDCIYVV